VDSLTGAVKTWPTEEMATWRTPDSAGSGGPRNRQSSIGNGHQVTIAEQAEHWQTTDYWPTAVTTDAASSARHTTTTGVSHPGTTLSDAISTWGHFPTPASRDHRTPNKKSYAERGGESKGEQLQNFVEHSLEGEVWRTPNTRDFHAGGPRPDAQRQISLVDQASTWVNSPPDPTIPDGPTSSGSAQTSRRRLNPRFVSWLMGFPLTWTER
jgi:hypothetical protein